MKSEAELRKAHDTLAAIILKEVNIPELQEEDGYLLGMKISHDTLCWALGCENDQFAQNLKGVYMLMEKHGYTPVYIEDEGPVKPTVYPAIEYNKAIRDIIVFIENEVAQDKDYLVSKIKTFMK